MSGPGVHRLGVGRRQPLRVGVFLTCNSRAWRACPGARPAGQSSFLGDLAAPLLVGGGERCRFLMWCTECAPRVDAALASDRLEGLVGGVALGGPAGAGRGRSTRRSDRLRAGTWDHDGFAATASALSELPAVAGRASAWRCRPGLGQVQPVWAWRRGWLWCCCKAVCVCLRVSA